VHGHSLPVRVRSPTEHDSSATKAVAPHSAARRRPPRGGRSRGAEPTSVYWTAQEANAIDGTIVKLTPK
jgi:hypothetical protein